MILRSAIAALAVALAQSAATNGVALVGGTLIDGTGAPPVRDSVVLIRGDRIERVGTLATVPVPAGYESISTEGMTVLPGLWDLHVHLIYSGHPNPGAWFKHDAEFESVTIPASARQMLMGGVTSVRDLAAPADAVLAVKRRIASGALPGPTIYAAGPALAKLAPNQTSVTSQFQPIDGADDARAKTSRLIDAGVDVVKIFFAERMSPAERAAIVGEAHARQKEVAMHGQTDAEVKAGWAAYQPRAPRADAETIVKRKVAQMREAGVELDEGSAAQFARHSTWMDADLWVRVLGLDPMWVLRKTLDAAAMMAADRDN